MNSQTGNISLPAGVGESWDRILAVMFILFLWQMKSKGLAQEEGSLRYGGPNPTCVALARAQQEGDSSQLWLWGDHIWVLGPTGGSQLKGGIHELEHSQVCPQ